LQPLEPGGVGLGMPRLALAREAEAGHSGRAQPCPVGLGMAVPGQFREGCPKPGRQPARASDSVSAAAMWQAYAV
jgi:hypothetical protein